MENAPLPIYTKWLNCFIKFRPQKNLDTIGLMALGTIQISPTIGLKFGQPINAGRPTYLSFSSRDSTVAGDSSFVLAYLTKWNLAEHRLDTVAHGKWGESGVTSGWTSHSINMNYDTTTVIPDSQQIFVSSSIYMRDGAKIGSTYWVDAFCWNCTAGINELSSEINTVFVSPNPATNETIESAGITTSDVEIIFFVLLI